MYACATDEGVCLLEFSDRRMLETELRDIQKKLNGIILIGENVHINQLEKELKQYFEGKRKTFDVQLICPGTEFQQSAWDNLRDIPYGETRSYQYQAGQIDKPNAVRAVASANGFNRIAIIIPCHRVIGKDGQLRGYGGGLERKKWLLDHEIKNKLGFQSSGHDPKLGADRLVYFKCLPNLPHLGLRSFKFIDEPGI